MEPTYCTCAIPRPVQEAVRKGASATVCASCRRPLPLTLGTPPPRAA